jgi:hypothetical protein
MGEISIDGTVERDRNAFLARKKSEVTMSCLKPSSVSMMSIFQDSELYAVIRTDKTQDSAKVFLEQVLEECPYTIGQYYTDNGKE